jgi:hypothetical protein
MSISFVWFANCPRQNANGEPAFREREQAGFRQLCWPKLEYLLRRLDD